MNFLSYITLHTYKNHTNVGVSHSLESRFIRKCTSNLNWLICLPFFLVLQSLSKILPYRTPTFAINNLLYFNQITPSANLQELLSFKYKSPLRCSSPTDIYFKGPVSVNASPGCNTSLLTNDEQHFFHRNFRARRLNRCKDFLS